MLHNDGWYEVSTTGSHRQLKHPSKPGKSRWPATRGWTCTPRPWRASFARPGWREQLIEYTVILEFGDNNWSAYVPDLPGCVAAAKTRDETERLIREAIVLHLKAMREDGDLIPPPTSDAIQVAVAG